MYNDDPEWRINECSRGIHQIVFNHENIPYCIQCGRIKKMFKWDFSRVDWLFIGDIERCPYDWMTTPIQYEKWLKADGERLLLLALDRYAYYLQMSVLERHHQNKRIKDLRVKAIGRGNYECKADDDYFKFGSRYPGQ